MCLFGIGVDLALEESIVRPETRGGGVQDCRIGACCTTRVAIACSRVSCLSWESRTVGDMDSSTMHKLYSATSIARPISVF